MSASHNTPADSVHQKIASVLNEGATAALVTLVSGAPGVGAKLLVERDGSTTGSLGSTQVESAVVQFVSKFLSSRDDTRVFRVAEFAPELVESAQALILFERIQPQPRIVICGAGHVGAALAKLAHLLGYHCTLIDDRAEFVQKERFAAEEIELIAAEDWFSAVRAAVGDGRGVSVAVVTRGHSEDETCMRAVMATGADYVGLIGSKRRTRIVLKRLRENGASPEQLEKVHAPIGLDIGAVTPEEVALAIIAEIVAVRRGGTGKSLSNR